MVKVNGTIINYYYHCKRQCWLFINKINLEDNAEEVKVGRVLHELASENKNTEIAIGNIKIDKVNDEYIIEMKKSDSDIQASIMQLKFYMYELRKVGIERKGKLQIIEKNKQDKKIHIIDYNERLEAETKKLIKEIENFSKLEYPPDVIFENKCKKCAYYEYCFL